VSAVFAVLVVGATSDTIYRCLKGQPSSWAADAPVYGSWLSPYEDVRALVSVVDVLCRHILTFRRATSEMIVLIVFNLQWLLFVGLEGLPVLAVFMMSY
jgi:hypothetical protein